MKKKLEIVNIEGKKYIVINNEAFDWELEPEQIKSISLKIKNDPLMKDSFIGNIFHHLVKSFSDFVGKQVSLKEMNDAIENGSIEI